MNTYPIWIYKISKWLKSSVHLPFSNRVCESPYGGQRGRRADIPAQSPSCPGKTGFPIHRRQSLPSFSICYNIISLSSSPRTIIVVTWFYLILMWLVSIHFYPFSKLLLHSVYNVKINFGILLTSFAQTINQFKSFWILYTF